MRETVLLINFEDYKAILTETNKTWTVPRLYEEISKEHEQMRRV